MLQPVSEIVYQVADWDAHFENDRSRTRDRCSFVCVPNKQHGMGFCYVVSEPDGGAIYGVWNMILGACSQQNLPRKGWLTSNGRPDGLPWDEISLSMKFRRPLGEIRRALDFLSTPAVGWLIRHSLPADSPSTHSPLPVDPPAGTLKDLKGRERKEVKASKTLKPPKPAKSSKRHSRENELMDDLRELLGHAGMVNDGGKWRLRCRRQPGKVERVVAETRCARREGRINTTPAQFSEDTWKRFA